MLPNTAGLSSDAGPGRPREAHAPGAIQPLLGAVCHACQMAPSVPAANTSSRLSALLTTAGLVKLTPCGLPRDVHAPGAIQPLLGAVCHVCQMANRSQQRLDRAGRVDI